MRLRNVCALAAMALCIGTALSAKATFVTYDDFNTGTEPDWLKWTGMDGSALPTVGDGALQMNGTGVPWQGLCSTERFGYGSFQFTLSSFSTGGAAHVFGLNSATTTDGKALDGVFLRDDSGALVYKNGTAIVGPEAMPSYVSTFPATYTFVRQPNLLAIYRNTGAGDVQLYKTTDAAIIPTGELRFDFTCYNEGASFNVDSVAFSAVPEPATIVLLGVGLAGLLAYAWRKRK